MVGRQVLVLLIGVRIPAPEPDYALATLELRLAGQTSVKSFLSDDLSAVAFSEGGSPKGVVGRLTG